MFRGICSKVPEHGKKINYFTNVPMFRLLPLKGGEVEQNIPLFSHFSPYPLGRRTGTKRSPSWMC